MYVITRHAGFLGKGGIVIRRVDGVVLGRYAQYQQAEDAARQLNSAIVRAMAFTAIENDAKWAGHR